MTATETLDALPHTTTIPTNAEGDALVQAEWVTILWTVAVCQRLVRTDLVSRRDYK